MWGRGDARVGQGPVATGSLSGSTGLTWGRCCVSCTDWDFQLLGFPAVFQLVQNCCSLVCGLSA